MTRWLYPAMPAALILLLAPIAALADDSGPELSSRFRGVTTGLEVGTGVFGYKATGSLGVQDDEQRSLGGQHYLLQWNGSAQGLGGMLANTHPYNAVYGVRAQASGEAGVRLLRDLPLSPYVGIEAGGSAHSVAVAGADSLHNINNTDGLAGTAGNAHVRLNVGKLMLNSNHSIELVAFGQGEVLSRETNSSAKLFGDVGLHGQVVLANNFKAVADALIGTTGKQQDKALGTTTETTRWAIAANVTKSLGPNWWIDGGLDVSRMGTTSSSAGSAQVFDTASPINATIGLGVGYSQ